MFKTGELLKRNIRRYVVPAVAIVVLAAITLVVCAAVSGKVVYIYDGEVVTNLKTSQPTVGEALAEAEMIPGEFDLVEPAVETAIEKDMEIHIIRAIPLSLFEEGTTKEIFTLKQTVAEVLAEQNIILEGCDSVTPAPDTAITRGMEIRVRRAKQLEYFADGGNITVNTIADTVGEMLNMLGVQVGEHDFTEPAMDTALTDGMTVRLVRVAKKTIEKYVDVGYQIEEKTTANLTKGTSRVVQNGKNGAQVDTYTVTFHDEVEVSKELVSSTVTRAPKNKIIEKGTAAPKKTTTATASTSTGGTLNTAKGENFSYKKMIVCTATAYDLSYESCGKNPGDPYYGITASGMKAGPGVIAVDPSVIPLGTKLYVEATDGSWTYGYCVAGDTGSGVYGNSIDLFFNTRQEVRNFGRRKANVYIL